MTYYIKGGSRFNEANPTVWCALNLAGFLETKYLDANWKEIGYETIIDTQDPFWLMGGATGGAKEFEIGLYDDYKLRFKTTGIDYYDGVEWTNLLEAEGAQNLNELNDVVITDPGEDDLLSWDNGSSKWINQTAAEAGLALSGHGHGQLHDQNHDNTYHTTNYKADFSENTGFNKDFGTLGTEVCVGNDSRLQDALKLKGKVIDDAALADDKILKYDLSSQQWKCEDDLTGGGAGNLGDLDDVVISGTPANHEFLIYDTGGNWINHTAAEAGISTTTHTHDTRYYTETEMNQFLHIGTANKGLIQMMYEGGYIHEKMRMDAAQHNWGNVDGTDFTLHFTSPLPLQLANGKHLHVDYIYVGLYDADGNNYLNNFQVNGMTSWSTQVQLYDLTTNQTTTGIKTFPTGTDDWGDYKRVTVEVNVVASNAMYFEMRYIEMRYWYA